MSAAAAAPDDQSATAPVGAFEMAMLMSVALASSMFGFVANNQIEANVARRLLTAVNLFACIILSFQTDVPRVARYMLAALGMTLLNSFLLAMRRLTTVVDTHNKKLA